MYKRCLREGGEVCAFFIADYRTFRKYGLGYAKPWPVPYKKQIRTGYLLSGPTIAELANEIGADPIELEKTISTFNPPARAGQDPEFGKGSTAYNVSLGDPQHRPNPCVAPIEVPPYFAVKVLIGDLGTFAGLSCDANARVLDNGGRPIPGLYASGNDALSIMGGNYPGGGITLGPAITFGYIAARHMSGANSMG
jgi:hypothetical protein